MENDEKTELYIVISMTAELPKKKVGCKVIPEGDIFLAIFSKVFGPDTKEICEKWVNDNCEGGISI